MKRLYASITVVICSFMLISQAQEVNITGTVKGDGSPISGARVSVKNLPHLVGYTNESGEFSITGSVPVINKTSSGRKTILATVNNNVLRFRTENNVTDVNIDLMTLQGRSLYSSQLKNLKAGDHSVNFNKKFQGINLVRLRFGTDAYIIKLFNGAGSVITKQSGMAGLSRTNLRTASSSAVNDTLVITAENWKHKWIDISDYNKQVNVTLFASNPWKPNGNLTRDKGMIQIAAKGHDFEMGQAEPIVSDDGLIYSEQPVHTVSFTYDFWMDTTEVTQKEFDRVMKKYHPDYEAPNSRSATYGVGDKLPVYFVNWDDAVLYCNAKSKEDGLDTVYEYSEINGTTGVLCMLMDLKSDLNKNGYRLPTEAEWEYACRGGTATDYYWGKNYKNYSSASIDTAEISKKAIWRANSYDIGMDVSGYGVHQVASTPANSYGLYDMAGNVSEHIHDFETLEYEYTDATDPAGPEQGDIHFIRGGNWGNDVLQLRSSSRNFIAANYPYFFCGFRTVKKAQ